MNLLTLARLISNISLVIAAGALFVLSLIGQSLQPYHLLMIAALALISGGVQFLVSVAKPNTIRPAWDEQTVASHRGSYQFGYWAAVICFWVFFATGASGSFLWLGVVLICAPSAWMLIAALTGRAG